jgi:3-oxoacyl-[acyl-carrier-protein] synthase II
MEPKEQRKVDDFIIFAMGAAHQALDDAAWKPASYDDQIKTGVMIGSGIGGLTGIAETAIVLKERGPRRVSPFFIPGRLINLASGYVSIAHGLRGPNHAVVTACSTGAHAIGDAARLVALGDAEVMVAGGAESPISRIGMAGFVACRALSTSFNDTPECASRPYDRDRDGFVMGDGAGIVVLETYEHAKNRGARIYAELIGYGLSGDAHHITAPAEDGDGALRCMNAALKRAGISAAEIDYINAHGTSTPLGRDRARGSPPPGRQRRGPHVHVLDQILDRTPLGRGRGSRAIFSILAMRRRRAAEHQSRQPVGGDADRFRPAPLEETRHRRCPLQFLRVRRNQCLPHFSPYCGLAGDQGWKSRKIRPWVGPTFGHIRH